MTRLARPRLGVALALLLLVLVAVCAWVGLRALSAQRHLTDARAQLTVARTALVDRDLTAARAAIDAASADTSRARALTGDPVWRLAGAVPGYGGTLRTASGLARAADELAGEVLPSALDAAELLDPAALRGADGALDLALLESATPPVTSSADVATAVLADVASLPRGDVVRQVAEARDELEEQVAELATTLQGTATALEAAPELLGADRPRRYFVLVQQNAESRGTGGLPGGFAVLETDRGRIAVAAAGSASGLVGGPSAVPEGLSPEFVSRYRELGSFDIPVNVNVSPDLPVVGRLVAQRWREQTGQELDGVIALDAQALAMILEGSGPVELDGRSVEPSQLPDYLAVGQYADFAPPLGGDLLALRDERRDAISDVAAATATRLASGGGDTTALLTAVADALRSGHLRVTSQDPVLGPLLAEAGVDGALPSGARPTAYPVVVNSTGGKLDTFLDRSVRYEAGSCVGDTRRSTITVTLTNSAPEGLPPYLRIRDDGEAVSLSDDSAVTLGVYTSPGAVLQAARLDGQALDPADVQLPLLRRFEEAGLQGFELFVDLPRQQPTTLELELIEPVLPGPAEVPEQPLARPLEREVSVPVC